MTNNQRVDAIFELAKGLTSNELRDAGYKFDDLADDLALLECEQNGHKIDDDMCGKPEHRFCSHCGYRETSINQARQAEVDEATDGKSVKPSESLGSGSTFDNIPLNRTGWVDSFKAFFR